MIIKRLSGAILGMALAMTASPVSAATLVLNGGGELTGARGVSVGGALYDVDFVDGTCVDLFTGCDENSDFTFAGDNVTAELAAEALHNQVFIGVFDDNPSLTHGCTGLLCIAWTPVSVSGLTVGGLNAFNLSLAANANGSPDFVAFNQIESSRDFADEPSDVWARWSEVSTVPLPAAGWMLLFAVACLAGLGRRVGQRPV